MQNPPSYVHVDSASARGSPYAIYGDLFRDHQTHHLMNHHRSQASPSPRPSHLHPAAHQRLLHERHSPAPVSAGFLPSPLQQARHFDAIASSNAALNDAFINSFGLHSGAFLSPYSYAAAADRNRTPSPLHRLLHSQLLGGHPAAASQADSYYGHEDLLFEAQVFSRSLSNPESRHHPHLDAGSSVSRSLDDLSADLDGNDNDRLSIDVPYQRSSSSPDESQVSTSNSSISNLTHATRVHYKQRKSGGSSGKSEISRTCPTCGKTFGNSSGLAKHRLTHSDERKYLCTTCMKSFKRQDHLTGHLLTHSDKKPFACPVEHCGKSYCDSRSLKRHLDQHEPWMVPDAVRLMYIDNPTEDLDDTRSLFDGPDSQHSGLTDALKPFICQICKRRFKNAPALNGHMRLHGGFFKKNEESGHASSMQHFKSSPPDVSREMDAGATSSMSAHSSDSLSEMESMSWNVPNNHTVQHPPEIIEPHSRMASPIHSPIHSPIKASHVPVICQHPPPPLHLQQSVNSVSPTPSTPTARTPTLPPVSTLASPTNSPTSPFSFAFGGPSNQNLAVPASMTSAAMTTLPHNEHFRRHSDSDYVQQPKRLCTMTDMLKRTMTMNMERRMNSMQSDPMSSFGNASLEFEPSVSIALPDTSTPLEDPSSSELDSVIGDDDVLESPKSVEASLNDLETPSSSQEPISDDSAIGRTPPVSRRKQRPSPLYIPPPETPQNPSQPQQTTPSTSALSPNSNGFVSNLRSPVIGGERKSALPPYTPPPILSPNRRGSGLYCTIMSAGMPMSGGRPCLKRSLSNSNHFGSSGSKEWDPTVSPFTFNPQPLETDTVAHINLGRNHQADLPELQDAKILDIENAHGADLMWNPKMVSHLSDDDVDRLMAAADTAAVPKGGRNRELAHHVLFQTGGDLLLALKTLMDARRTKELLRTTFGSNLYRYQLTSLWTPEEIQAFSTAVYVHEKDFFAVANSVKTKSVKECVEFYYIWKKVLTEDYRSYRRARDRRMKGPAAATRNRVAQIEGAAPVPFNVESAVYPCSFAACGMAFPTAQALHTHARTHVRTGRADVSLDTCPPPAPKPVEKPKHAETRGKTVKHAAKNTEDEFPCMICGKTFSFIKSRNAHMKVHSMANRAAQARGVSSG